MIENIIIIAGTDETKSVRNVFEAFKNHEYYKVPFMVNQFSMEAINDVYWDAAGIKETNGKTVIEYYSRCYADSIIAKDISALFGYKIYYHYRIPNSSGGAYIIENGEKVHSRKYLLSLCEQNIDCPGAYDDPETLAEWNYNCEKCQRENPNVTKRYVCENEQEIELPPDVNMFDWVEDLLKEL